MRLIYESPLCGFYESAERIFVYEPSDENEVQDFEEMSYEEKCACCGVTESDPWATLPGGTGYTYRFETTQNHIIVCEILTLDV